MLDLCLGSTSLLEKVKVKSTMSSVEKDNFFLDNKKEAVDGVLPKISPTISFSGMYQKSFMYRSNGNNSQ